MNPECMNRKSISQAAGLMLSLIGWLSLAESIALALDAQDEKPTATPTYRSHPPMRPLPTAATRPLAAGPKLFVDAVGGDDAADGSKLAPWRTLKHALRRLKPGDTLYLRGGTYYEHVFLSQSGTAEAPIVVASYPGELAVIDGGLRDFLDNPGALATAGRWRSGRIRVDQDV